MAATTYATAAPVTITSEGYCESDCSTLGVADMTPAFFSLTIDATPGEQFRADNLLDFTFTTGDWTFTKSMAAGLYVGASRAVWNGGKRLPFPLTIIAAEKVGTEGRYLNIGVIGDYFWTGHAGFGTCTDATCTTPQPGSIPGRNNATVAVPVPLPPALALMAAPVLAFAAVRRRRRVLHGPS